MPNSNYPRGLVSVRRGYDSTDGAVRRYAVAAGDTTPLRIGDPVLKTGAADADGYSIVTRATPAGAVTGVVEGFEDPTAMQAGFRAASTAGYVIVNDHPETLYEIQADGVLPLTAIGQNADFIVSNPPAGQRQSNAQLAVATAATTATLPLRIIEMQHKADNSLTEANVKVLVTINNHTERSASAGV